MSVLSEEKIEALWQGHVLPGFADQQKFISPTVFARAIEAAVLEAQEKQEPVAWKAHHGSLAYSRESFSPSTRHLATPLYAAPVVQPDPVLCNFYQVDTFPDLVAAMEHHIEKLQAKVPPIGNNWSGESEGRMKRELQTQQLIKEDAKRLCAKILKTIGPEKQIIAMNALYLAMQIVAAAEGKK